MTGTFSNKNAINWHIYYCSKIIWPFGYKIKVHNLFSCKCFFGFADVTRDEFDSALNDLNSIVNQMVSDVSGNTATLSQVSSGECQIPIVNCLPNTLCLICNIIYICNLD